MWRPRDRERYLGTYDPEHEMPDPERDPGDRWQSDAYRRGARDSRFAYRWDADRFEDRFGGRRDVDRDYEMRWRDDAREREREMGRGWRPQERHSGYGSRVYSGDRGRHLDDRYGRDFGGGYRSRGEYGMDYDRERGSYGGYGRSPYRGSDRGWDRDEMFRVERHRDESDFGRGGRYDDRDWRRR